MLERLLGIDARSDIDHYLRIDSEAYSDTVAVFPEVPIILATQLFPGRIENERTFIGCNPDAASST